MPLQSLSEWEYFLQGYPDAHVLQSAAWGELKAGFGWQVERVRVEKAGAQVLFRRLPFGLSLAYIPKGPVGPNWPGLWPDVIRLCRRKRAVLLKVEPDCWESDAAALPDKLPGFRVDGIPVQPRRTILVSLAGREEDWLERMKQKTRYNIRLAERKGVTVNPSTDVETFHRLMLVTGQRDRFGVHSVAYYQRVYELFHQRGLAELLIAEYEGSPLAGLMVFKHGKRAWYFYGASNDAERSRMPTYLLQWQAMRWAAGQGCSEYDLWGVPDEDEGALESQFEQRHDGLWGVYRFKRGFGGSLIRSAPTYEKALIAPLFHFYRWYARRRDGEQG